MSSSVINTGMVYNRFEYGCHWVRRRHYVDIAVIRRQNKHWLAEGSRPAVLMLFSHTNITLVTASWPYHVWNGWLMANTPRQYWLSVGMSISAVGW